MSGFTVPASSSPLAPSTPGSGKKPFGGFFVSHSPASNPSTTPAGPPPSSARSFTPAGAPPSFILGSSQLDSSKSPSKSADISSHQLAPREVPADLPSSPFGSTHGVNSFSNNRFALPNSSLLSQDSRDGQLDSQYGEFKRNGGDADASRNQAQGGGRKSPADKSPFPSTLNGNWGRKDDPTGQSFYEDLGDSVLIGGVKRSRGGAIISRSPQNKSGSLPKGQKESAIPSIAKHMENQLGTAPLDESRDLILGTETLIRGLYDGDAEGGRHEEATSAELAVVSEGLCSLWTSCRSQELNNIAQQDDVMAGIGPDENAPMSHSAIYLGTLLLPLQHPGAAVGKQALALSRFNRTFGSSRTSHPVDTTYKPTAYPKILLEWIDRNHNPFESTFRDVLNRKPNPTAHQNYWDVMFMLTVRGKIAHVVQLLKAANFEHGATAREDGHGSSGYTGGRLRSIERVITRAVQVFEACPALTEDNWDLTANKWILFRRFVEKALDDLTTFAEGRDRDLDSNEDSFEAPNFGLNSMPNEMTASSRRAESRVPWTIFQNLKTTYGILLGGGNEILSSSQDWVEGTIALTAWWTGDDDDEVAINGSSALKRSLRPPRSRGPRLVDQNPRLAYLRRLSAAYERVTDENEEDFLLPDSTKPLEIALSCLFENNMNGLLGILRGFSLPIADAVAEVASAGGWLVSGHDNGVIDGLDDSDLMVLSSYSTPRPVDLKREIMTTYADALFSKGTLGKEKGSNVEGWEVSIAVLARMSPFNSAKSKKRISEYLERVSLESDERVDRILELCVEYDMFKEGSAIVDRYADSVVEDSDRYGTALVYYARAHKRRKIKDVLDLLISFSLVQSKAYPSESALDPNLRALIFDPQRSLRQLAALDGEAARILHTGLSGYAALRKFYHIRDAEINRPESQAPSETSTVQDPTAVKYLFAVINSAADSIQGGLFDDSRGSIVQVDGLLALLGEATVFIDQSPSHLTLQQSTSLLKAIEDLTTISSRIFNQCEEFLRSTLASYGTRGAKISSPHALLKKQVSSTTTNTSNGGGIGSFSLVGSSLLLDPSDKSDVVMKDSHITDATTDTGTGRSSSRALVIQPDPPEDDDGGAGWKRGWDWRNRFVGDGEGKGEGEENGKRREVRGRELLMELRLGLAREIAGHWIKGDGALNMIV